MLKMLCEKCTHFVSRCWGLHLEKIRAIANVLIVAKTHGFVKKIIGKSQVFIDFHINIYAEFNNR